MFLAVNLYRLKVYKNYPLLLGALGFCMILDPLLSTSCRTITGVCEEIHTSGFVFHAIESVATSLLFFIVAAYDSWRRKKLVSIGFTIFQVGYGFLFLSQWANHNHYNTISQYVYQTTLIVWLAWLGRDLLFENYFPTIDFEEKLVRNVTAGWSFINGILAIVISLAHINLIGRFRVIYFSDNTAWLAQHGIIVGVVLIYLARHLARGEARARQIFLWLIGIEVLKYSVISPDGWLLAFYTLTFITLFLLRDNFDRGTIALTWQLRIRDLYFLLVGLLMAAFISLVLLDRDGRVSITTTRAVDNFTDYVFRSEHFPRAHINSVLLAHSLSAFIAAAVFAVLWILFRPYRFRPQSSADYQKIENSLKHFSNSTEDFFKLWPRDKNYYWKGDEFVAYKVVGSVAYCLADPMAKNRKQLAQEFVEWCRSRRLSVCYLPVYESSLKLYQNVGLEDIQIGSSAIVDINEFLLKTSKDKWWRWRINRAVKNGYEYQISLPPHNDPMLNEMRKLSNAWQREGRKEHGFAMGYFSEEYLQKCTIHYLQDANGTLISFTNEVPQFKTNPTFTVDLLRSEPGSDSMAYLLYKMIEQSQGKYQKFDLGFVPFAKARGSLQAIAKTLSADRFAAKGLEQFKNKFNPAWAPNYLAYDGDKTDLGMIAINIEQAMEAKNITN